MKNLGLFCGGFSSEFDISMKSAQTIFDHFPKAYDVYKIQVVKGDWFCEINGEKGIFNRNNGSIQFQKNKISIETALICIHGVPGENGKIEALLDLIGIPFINSSAKASSLTFDKYLCNQFLNARGFRTAKSQLITKDIAFNVDSLITELKLPFFVKPTESGSSFGISKVNKKDDLLPAIEVAFKEGDTIIAESFLDGIELTCAVFRSPEGLIALPITQVSTDNDFFDYDAKYNGKSKEETPAKVSAALTIDIQNTSKEIYNALQLKSVARIDYIVIGKQPFVIEVNTIPGFSKASIVPQMLSCQGIPLDEFWSMVIDVELNS